MLSRTGARVTYAKGLCTLGLFLVLGGGVYATAGASATTGSTSVTFREQARDLADNADALFAHTAKGGSAERKKDGTWVVKLRGVPRKALAFEDRPGRREEPISMTRMLAGFFSKPGADLPNAALSLQGSGGEQSLMGVELLNGRYDPDRRVAFYRLRGLKQHGDQKLRLPSHFGDASVFIDTIYNDCDTMVVGAPPLTLQGIDSADHDSWKVDGWGAGGDWYATPPPSLAPNPPTGPFSGYNAMVFGTESGFARGCWNNANYADANGSVEFSVGDPYTGSNSWSCVGTGAYVCDGPMDFEQYPLPTSGFGGDTVAVIWAICSTNNPNCGEDQGLVPAGYQQHPCNPQCPPPIPKHGRLGG
jgi:hypothetical protein